MAPSNPNMLTPQAPPPSPKPPGAHALQLKDRESPAGHLFLPIEKHLVSLNVLHLPHPFFQPLPQRTSPNGSQGGPPLTSAGMGGAERQGTRPAIAGPSGQVCSTQQWVCISRTLEVLESGPGCFKSPGDQRVVTWSSCIIQGFDPGNRSHPPCHCASRVMTEHLKEALSSLNLRFLDHKMGTNSRIFFSESSGDAVSLSECQSFS